MVYSVFQSYFVKNLILGHVNFEMSCEICLCFVCFAALVALERPLSRVLPCVALQITRRSTNEVALVTLVWLFSCVLPHHMGFQVISCNAGILTHRAPVRLFPRVGPFVLLQIG